MMITFFAFCGGAIGGILLMLGGLVFMLVSPSSELPADARSWLELMFAGLTSGALFGAIFGFPPALIGGAIYAYLPPTLQRIVVAPFVGAVVSGCWALAFGTTMLLPLALTGAAAAMVCAVIARAFGIDFWPRDGKPTAEPS